EIIRALVKRVEIDTDEVRVVYKVPPHPFAESPEGGCLQDRLGRGVTTPGQHRSARTGGPGPAAVPRPYGERGAAPPRHPDPLRGRLRRPRREGGRGAGGPGGHRRVAAGDGVGTEAEQDPDRPHPRRGRWPGRVRLPGVHGPPVPRGGGEE